MNIIAKIEGMFGRIVPFLKEVQLEAKKVNWLTKDEAIKYTLIVILTSVTMAAFLGGLDFIFNQLLDKLVLH